MLCPRCEIEVTDGQCPSCGIVWEEDSQAVSPPDTVPGKTVVGGEAFALGFEMLEPRATESQSSAGWREELKRRLEEHSARTKDEPADLSEPESTGQSQAKSPGSDQPKAHATEKSRPTPKQEEAPSTKIFDYRLKKPPPPRKTLLNPVRHREDVPRPPRGRKEAAPDPLLSRELVRGEGESQPPKPLRKERPLAIPLQGRLNLEAPASSRPGTPALQPKPNEDKVPRVPRISREILFSRFLAGVVDLTFPLALGVAFSLVAAWRIGFDFFSPDSIQSAVLLSLGFYLFNSSFFLLLAGQTPGMYVAQLALVSDEGSRDIPFASTVLRVLLFIPSALSVVGLVWGTVDARCRCLHDVLSGTRIAPLSELIDESPISS